MIVHDVVSVRTVLRPGDTLPILANPAAGPSGESRSHETIAAFRAAGFEIAWIEVPPAELTDAAREWIDRGARAIGVAGGDGSISTVARVLLNTGVVLVPVPLGTLNHFANRYGMGSVDAVTHALAEGVVFPVPAGSVDHIAFVNNASIGFYPHLVRHRDRHRRWLGKWPAALAASFWVLLKLPLIDLQVTFDGRTVERRTAALWIGLGYHSLRLPIPGDAERTGAVLELVLPKPTTRIELIGLGLHVLYQLWRGHPPSDERLETLRSQRVRIASERAVDIATDGEAHRLTSPLDVEYRTAALRVLGLVAPEASAAM